MKAFTLNIEYQHLAYEELNEEDRKLVDLAKQATDTSYVPYSHFHVGAAALLENGAIVCGSNQENAAYPSGTCAERCTLFYANARYPEAGVKTLAIAARREDGGFTDIPISPCGACRQVLAETEHRYGKPMRVILYGAKGSFIIIGVKGLLPFQFDADSL